MKKKVMMFLSLFFMGIGIVMAQTQVQGTVVDDKGEPVIGATIQIKGDATRGAITDYNGKFTLSAPTDGTLIVSYVGMETIEVEVSPRIRVILTTDAALLEEVVVTAYGTVTKKAFTGTAAIVKADEVQNLKVSSISKALQGLASGVLVVNSSGQPGQNATIRIRGVGSFSGSSTPLIVVDGVIFNGNLNNLNPNDIESYTVLKDANSTALYGSRAANGVILITTKMGRVGKTQISASASYGISSRAVDDYKYLNVSDYYTTKWRGMYNNFIYADTPLSAADAAKKASEQVQGLLVYSPFSIDNPVGLDGKIKPEAKVLWDEDWYDALLRTGQRQEYNLQAMGGTEKNRFLISAAYLHDDGMVQLSKFDRYNLRGKIDSDVTRWLKVGLNMGLTYSDQNFPTQGGTSYRNSIQAVRIMSGIYPAYQRNRDGSFIYDAKGDKMPDYGTLDDNPWKLDRPIAKNSSPLGTFMFDDLRTTRFSTNNSGYLEARFLNDFTYKTTLGVEYFLLGGKEYYNNIVGDGKAYGGRSERSHRQTTMINWTNTFVYDKNFNEDHHLNVLLGTESNDWKTNYLAAETRGFDFDDQELDYGANKITASSNRTASRNFRYLARVNYDYAEKYHLSMSFTRDGSSRFYKDSRWGNFYSLGVGWNVINEDFMTSLKPMLSSLKLRASYGTSGSQSVTNESGYEIYFPYMGTYDTGWNILGSLGSIVSSLENRLLTWEKQKQLDLGIDFGFLSHKLTGSITYYSRKSSDLLMARPLPLSAGITSYNDNVGEVQNTGVETELKAYLLQSRDWSIDLGANITFQKNEVTALPEEQKDGFDSPYSTAKRIEVGHSMYSWYLREFAGVDPEDGLAMWYKDIIDDKTEEVTGRETTKVYADGTRYIVGDALPKVIGGINGNVAWRGVSLNIITSFALGGKIADYDKAGLMHMMSSDRTGYQASVDMLNAWSQKGDITDIARLGDDSNSFSSMSTRWLVSGDYFRIRNITFGYDLSRIQAIKKLGFSKLQAYVSADNYFTFFGSQGLDPEAGLGGVTRNNSSALKVLSLGLNVQF